MRIFLINKYLYEKGGDAISTINTGRLLLKKGHDVVYWGMSHPENPPYPAENMFVRNVDYGKRQGVKEKVRISLNLLYSIEAKSKLEALIKKTRPDLVHLNNFAHQISPSILDVLDRYRIPSVMTMHDYKIVCSSYRMLSGEKICEKCRGGAYFRCALERCVKGSFAKSLLNSLEMYLHHDILKLYDKVDTYVSPSRFLGRKVNEMGFEHEIEYLPNFVNTGDYAVKGMHAGKKLLYFGRLSREKGIKTLINAVAGLDVTLCIAGKGPMEEELKSLVKVKRAGNIRFLGYRRGGALAGAIADSNMVVIPSEWYENNPRSVIEAFAMGRPVIGANIGGIPELVIDGKTGMLFEPGNPDDLRDKIIKMTGNRDAASGMGANARKYVEDNLSEEKHYAKLMDIYEAAGKRKKRF